MVRLGDLPRGEYPVEQFSLVETRYGKKLKLDLGDKFVYLPSSASAGLNDDKIVELNSLPQIFVWGGYGDSQFEPWV